MKSEGITGIGAITLKLEVTASSIGSNFNTLLLCSDPNPGYYSRQNFPPNQESAAENHYYILIKNPIPCFQDEIFRIREELSAGREKKLRIYPGQMTYLKSKSQCIRINTSSLSDVEELLAKLRDHNIPVVSHCKSEKYISTICYKKPLTLSKIQDNVYEDRNNPYRYFFSVMKTTDIEELDTGMDRIKSNCNFHLFDAFQAWIQMDDQLLDFIGIFSKHCDKNRFAELQENIEKVFNQ